MKKVLLALITLASSLYGAAVIQVTCDGDTTMASGVNLNIGCSASDGAFANASTTGLSLMFAGGNSTLLGLDSGGAQGSLDATQTVTISGGSGSALLGFIPAASGLATEADFCIPSGPCVLGDGLAYLSVDGQRVWAFESAMSPFGAFFPALIPFAFGVPFTLDYTASGSANFGSSNISFSGLDPKGLIPTPGGGPGEFWITSIAGPLGADFTVTAGPVTLTPEPGTAALVCLGIFIVGLRLRPRPL